MTPKTKTPSPPRAITSVILSMGLMAIGSGLLFSFIPVQLADKGFPPWVAGTIVTAMAAGGLVACLITGLIVRRVSHARAFATLTAFVILSILMIALGTYPIVWVAARVVYGFAATGLFIGPEDCWQFSVLIFVCSQILKSAEGDIQKLLDQYKKGE